ncbi:MAG TPA: hypothetical protein VFN61_11850 [Acidimicrobiales bacterium]|nr:hypothetical protein [Acidimicrobiales bacterium]
MTRTTLDLDAEVLQQLRLRADLEDKSLGALASELLSEALGTSLSRQLPPLAWTSRDMGAASDR